MTTKRKKRRVMDASKFLALHDGTGAGAIVPGYALPSANAKIHWSQVRSQRLMGKRIARWLAGPLPVTVTLERIGKRLLDRDNLVFSFKHVRDGIADAFGVSDGPDGPIAWRYEQERGEYAIKARVEPR